MWKKPVYCLQNPAEIAFDSFFTAFNFSRVQQNDLLKIKKKVKYWWKRTRKRILESM